MGHCIETILPLGNDIEIILVNDGSKDRTGEICDRYANEYPNIIKAFHQENGGHGEGVNVGLSHASGHFFKVVDSDDWLDTESAKQVLSKLKELKDEGLDMLISNYVYEHAIDNSSRAINYTNVLPQNRAFSWGDIKRFRISQYLLMHSIIYRTSLLKACGLKLPKHTFYVDNIYAYVPLPYVKSIYYLDVDLYRYFIGRADQSVNESIMVKRVAQQIRITKIMLESHDLESINQPKLEKYMSSYLTMMISICSILLLLEGKPESENTFDDLWQYLRDNFPTAYANAKRSPLSFVSYSKGKLGRMFTLTVYRTARSIYHFN
jgi:glycosyltransferase involved in cell wall biosynthesis